MVRVHVVGVMKVKGWGDGVVGWWGSRGYRKPNGTK